MAPWTSQYERASPSIFTQFVYCGRPFLQVHKSLFYITMTQWKAVLPLGIKFCRSRWNHDSRKTKKREYTIKSTTPGASSRGRAYQTHFCQRLLVSVVVYLVCEVTLKLLQYCNYIIIVMQIKLMLLLLLLRNADFFIDAFTFINVLMRSQPAVWIYWHTAIVHGYDRRHVHTMWHVTSWRSDVNFPALR